jgi:hypothetical protein
MALTYKRSNGFCGTSGLRQGVRSDPRHLRERVKRMRRSSLKQHVSVTMPRILPAGSNKQSAFAFPLAFHYCFVKQPRDFQKNELEFFPHENLDAAVYVRLF